MIFSVFLKYNIKERYRKNITILSSVDSLDWQESATVESICNRVIKKVTNGSIVLFHNDAKYTPKALPTILKTLKDDGYEFKFIADMIYSDNYKIDVTGKQIKCDKGEVESKINSNP